MNARGSKLLGAGDRRECSTSSAKVKRARKPASRPLRYHRSFLVVSKVSRPASWRVIVMPGPDRSEACPSRACPRRFQEERRLLVQAALVVTTLPWATGSPELSVAERRLVDHVAAGIVQRTLLPPSASLRRREAPYSSRHKSFDLPSVVLLRGGCGGSGFSCIAPPALWIISSDQGRYRTADRNDLGLPSLTGCRLRVEVVVPDVLVASRRTGWSRPSRARWTLADR
jgi:hypothetical protein